MGIPCFYVARYGYLSRISWMRMSTHLVRILWMRMSTHLARILWMHMSTHLARILWMRMSMHLARISISNIFVSDAPSEQENPDHLQSFKSHAQLLPLTRFSDCVYQGRWGI